MTKKPEISIQSYARDRREHKWTLGDRHWSRGRLSGWHQYTTETTVQNNRNVNWPMRISCNDEDQGRREENREFALRLWNRRVWWRCVTRLKDTFLVFIASSTFILHLKFMKLTSLPQPRLKSHESMISTACYFSFDKQAKAILPRWSHGLVKQ